MYRFNFLSKINQEKLEEKKRDSFIKLIFISSTSLLILLLIILFLHSLNIGSNFNVAQEFQEKITAKSSAFRNNDFFSFKRIENVYNSALKRRNITSVINTIESSLDSTLIIEKLSISDKVVNLKFISRTSASKSQLWSRIDALKNQINEKLISVNYIDAKKELSLLKGPDIAKSYDEFQYWVFEIGGEFKEFVPAKAPVETQKEGVNLNM
jgi:hypothetical protein